MIRIAYLVMTDQQGDNDDTFVRTLLLPALRVLPGLRRVEAGFLAEKPFGSTAVRGIVDAWFDSEDEMNAAMASAEGKALARAFMANPGAAVEMLVLRQDDDAA